MGKKIATRLASIALTVAIPLSGVNVAYASEASSTGTVTASQIAKSSEDSDMASEAADIENGLELIYSIPDQVLQQGDKVSQEWLADHRPASTTTRANTWGCTAAITLFLGTNLVSAAKLLKIKRLIAELGGVREAMQIMWGTSFSYEKMREAGGALAALAGEFFGITSIRNECFN